MAAAKDLRAKIPVCGLAEYWYPAIEDRRVSSRKPTYLRMLDQDLCLFRGKSGKVVALANACPHRGAMLSHGNCEFRGHVACFYHGFVFDERGDCVAALGEGPNSPMPGKIQAKTYPTETHKGMVFVWMGKGEPVPITEDVPEDFFQPDTTVLGWHVEWNANWRPCFENSFDSHPRYLHRNSFVMLTGRILPPHFPIPTRPKRVGKGRLTSCYAVVRGSGKPTREYQDYFAGLDDKWPRHRWRLLWAWFFDYFRAAYRKLPRFTASEEWETGQHLPCMVRINYGSHMFTRWAVPIDAEHTRMFYFHSAVRRSAMSRFLETAGFYLYHNIAMNKNFSGQDLPAAQKAYYDKPEFLAPSDTQVISWRRMVLTGRGLEEQK